jgi:hypothetical protein
MFRRHHVLATATTLLCLTVFAAGCGDDEKATPQVIFEGELQTTTAALEADEKNCGETGPVFQIGEFGVPALQSQSKPVKDGDTYNQGTVGVSCSVKPAGPDEFDVSASLSLSGSPGGTFTLTQARVKTSGDQTGIRAVIAKRPGGNVYQQRTADCTIRYIAAHQGVAAGRIWGQIECPKVTNSTALTACKLVADFRLENCEQ